LRNSFGRHNQGGYKYRMFLKLIFSTMIAAVFVGSFQIPEKPYPSEIAALEGGDTEEIGLP